MSKNNYNKTGFIALYRKILTNELWTNKPPWWLKVWLYILIQVNHKDRDKLKRGEGFFTYSEIMDNCYPIKRYKNTKVTHHVISFLKKVTAIVTTKVTGGIIIKVVNYDEYNIPEKIKSDNKSDNKSARKVTDSLQKSDNKTEQCINNENNIYTHTLLDQENKKRVCVKFNKNELIKKYVQYKEKKRVIKSDKEGYFIGILEKIKRNPNLIEIIKNYVFSELEKEFEKKRIERQFKIKLIKNKNTDLNPLFNKLKAGLKNKS